MADRKRQFAKALVRNAMRVPGSTSLSSLLLRRRAVIFMLHRFRVPEIGVDGHDTAIVKEGLAYLRRKRYDLVSLQELFNRLAEGRPVFRTVAFTMDDGYLDQATVAAKVFKEYDCPVTTFVTTGFLDGALWFWWDQIEYIFDHTQRRELRVKLADEVISYVPNHEGSWQQAKEDFTARCKEVPDGQRIAGILALSREADVGIPAGPPLRYAPMTWDQARSCEQQGMTFGPHTVRHPILSKTTDDQCAGEISDSWGRLCSQVRRPVPIFCYPNGRQLDFGKREIDVMRESGLVGAVMGVPGYPETGTLRQGLDAPFKLRRFGYPNNLTDLMQVVSGVERFKQMVRRET
jgi:peptidoglycan/xylan/chitin deacetylase (PgdA/CDA1 family)